MDSIDSGKTAKIYLYKIKLSDTLGRRMFYLEAYSHDVLIRIKVNKLHGNKSS